MAIILAAGNDDFGLKETELCLGLPGGGGGADQADQTPKASGNKRGFSETEAETTVDLKLNLHQSKESVDLNDSLDSNSSSKEKNSILSSRSSGKDLAKPPAK